jgi:uncharacterized membrane protein
MAGVLEKVAVQASNPVFYSLSSCIGAILSLTIAMIISKQKITTDIKPLVRKITAIGALQSTSYLSYLLAIAAGPIAYVSALRSTNIFMGSILGILVFNERLTKPKIISFMLISIGALLLAFGS